MRAQQHARALWIAAAGAIVPGCTCGRNDVPPATKTTEAPPPAVGAEAGASHARPVVLDVLRSLDACSLGHRGVLLDFGDASMRAHLHPGSIAPGSDDRIEREGATWLRARSRSMSATFYWPPDASPSPEAGVYLEARVRGVTARAASVTLDRKTVGTWRLARGETSVVLARPAVPMAIAPGAHEIEMRFVGGPRTGGEEPFAEIDWVHVGTGETGDHYAAPTRADAVTDAVIGGTSVRALSLRAPGFVRCAAWIPANATIEASLAAAGGGEADVEARLLLDRRPPAVLGTAHVVGASAWTPWSIPVTGLDGDGALASIELVVKRASKGARVLVGEPRVVAADTPPAAMLPSSARGVVVVILGSTPAKALAPWGGPHAAPELSRLASGATTFVAHRAPSSLASAVVASMLTGMPPSALALEDPDARLPKGPTALEEACRQGGVATAMFTANPTTGAAFGFDRGWDSFVAHDPTEDAPATRLFDEAIAWIEAHKSERFLVVVHARGAHPPWDATADDLKTMPPEGYLGLVEPRRAAEALAKARRHPARIKEEDRVRAWALRDHAIDEHDAALGRLIAALHAAKRDGDTAIVVTADVGDVEAPPVPFADTEALDESVLATPLVVAWPHAAALAGKRIDAPTTALDVARTAISAMGLAPPPSFGGIDLALVAGGASGAARPLVATRADRFAIRWGSLVLAGLRDRETRMCDLSLDAACAADVRSTSPLALEPLRAFALDAVASPAPLPREPVTFDPHTIAALVRWGRPADDRDLPDDR